MNYPRIGKLSKPVNKIYWALEAFKRERSDYIFYKEKKKTK